MTRTPAVVHRVLDVGLAAAFLGLAALGLALVWMAATFPGGLMPRLAVLILGVGGLAIGLGYLATVRGHLRPGTP